jgi:DNA-binding NarL/FixJ family response regulator
MKMVVKKTIGVLVIDDAESIRLSFHRFLDAFTDLRWIGESSDGRNIVDDCTRLQPDVILIDVALPHVNVAEATHAIRSQFPSIQVIGTVGFEDRSITDPILHAGAALCISKNANILLIADAVRQAAHQIDPTHLVDRTG